jgi:hypothetical protein
MAFEGKIRERCLKHICGYVIIIDVDRYVIMRKLLQCPYRRSCEQAGLFFRKVACSGCDVPSEMKSIFFWDMTPCNALSGTRRFGGTYRLHLQGCRIVQRSSEQAKTTAVKTSNPTFRDVSDKVYDVLVGKYNRKRSLRRTRKR